MYQTKLWSVLLLVLICSVALTACSSRKTDRQETSSSQGVDISEVTSSQAKDLVTAYIDKYFPNKYSIEELEQSQIDESIYQEGYYYFEISTKSDNDDEGFAVEPCIAVKKSDSTLWAAYPDKRMVPIADDDVWKSK